MTLLGKLRVLGAVTTGALVMETKRFSLWLDWQNLWPRCPLPPGGLSAPCSPGLSQVWLLTLNQDGLHSLRIEYVGSPCSTIIKTAKKGTAEYQNKHRALLNTVPWPVTRATRPALELALDPHRSWLKHFLSLHMALQLSALPTTVMKPCVPVARLPYPRV